MILMLRYPLETCSAVSEAVAALVRIPIAASRNIVLLAHSGDHAILYLGPDRDPALVRRRACSSRRDRVRGAPCAACRRWSGRSSVDTAVYRPAEGRPGYVWPGKTWPQAIGAFVPGDDRHDYGEMTP